MSNCISENKMQREIMPEKIKYIIYHMRDSETSSVHNGNYTT